MHYQPLKPAQIEYRGTVPVSLTHDDPYFSLDNGLAESRHVFLVGCELPLQWQGRDRFTILETGFGTGLNLFATWQLWQQHRRQNAGAVLHYISIEAHPLSAEQIQRAMAPWPELEPMVSQYITHMPPAICGFHRRWFEHDGLCLTLLYGDVLDCLKELEATVHAFYLDGFAPRQNADMWQPAVYDELSRLGETGARLSTFTAAGLVRQGLAAAGFEVSKVSGYGRKRDMVTARLDSASSRSSVPGWLAMPDSSDDIPLVCGRGIAGAAAAHAWHMRGISVAFEDRQPDRSASKNPLALVSPRLPAAISREGQLMLSAALYAKSLYQQADCLKYPDVLVPETQRYDAKQQLKVLETWQLPQSCCDHSMPHKCQRPAPGRFKPAACFRGSVVRWRQAACWSNGQLNHRRTGMVI